jgi:hypothetical protein
MLTDVEWADFARPPRGARLLSRDGFYRCGALITAGLPEMLNLSEMEEKHAFGVLFSHRYGCDSACRQCLKPLSSAAVLGGCLRRPR